MIFNQENSVLFRAIRQQGTGSTFDNDDKQSRSLRPNQEQQEQQQHNQGVSSSPAIVIGVDSSSRRCDGVVATVTRRWLVADTGGVVW
jgi:hypothetical protein